MDDCSHFEAHRDEKERLINEEDEPVKKPEEILEEMKKIALLISDVSAFRSLLIYYLIGCD